MTWISCAIVVVLLALLLVWKRRGLVSAEVAQEYLKQGAVVIDVRSAGEFLGGHLPRAINIPLSEIETVISRKVSGKEQVLLLHCQSGTRSAIARKKLLAMGYTNAFNLGAYGRAAQILGAR